MLSFTFDTNCIIDLDEKRPASYYVLKIIEAHRAGQADAAFVAVSASERQRNGSYISNYDEFMDRLVKLQISDIPYIMGMAYLDLSFWDVALLSSEEMKARERRIHEAMFPNVPFDWPDYAKKYGLSVDSALADEGKAWRNRWCDRQIAWAHDYHGRDILVTSNMKDFGRLHGAPGFETFKACTPDQASEMLA